MLKEVQRPPARSFLGRLIRGLPKLAGGTVSGGYSRVSEMAQPLGAPSGNGEGHAARLRHAACRS